MASLIRIVDTFTVQIEAGGLTGHRLGQAAVLLSFTVYTRWGEGQGEFKEELRLVLPTGKEIPDRQPVTFRKPSGFHFQQVRRRVAFPVKDSGIYRLRVYLDGKPAGEHPFRVDIVEGTAA